MASNDSPWIDFLVTDPYSENPRAEMAADDVRREVPEARLELELVYVKRARREVPRALELPFPELPEIEGLRNQRRKGRTIPDWLVGDSEDWTSH